MASTERAPAPRVLLGVTGGIAAYKSARARSPTRRARLRGAGRHVARRARVRRPADVSGRVGPPRARRSVGFRRRSRHGSHRARALGRRRRRRSGDRALPGHAGRRLGRRSAVDVVSRDDGADRARAGHESGDVGQPGGAGESSVARGARRAFLRPRDGRSSLRRDGAGPHARAQRDRRGVARANGPAARAAARRASRSSSRRGPRASRSTPCATSRTAARERWASPSRLRRAKPARRSCS